MVRFEKSKNGALTAISNDVYLSSRYDPSEEARRFVNKQLQDDHPQTVVILGETLGYIGQAVSDRHPECRCIQIYYDTALYRQSLFRADLAWHPEAGGSYNTFFRQTIAELDLGSLLILEWAPAGKAYPVLAQQVLINLRQRISIYNGNIATTALFGQRWLRNIVHNFLNLDRLYRFSENAGLVMIAAAGPSWKRHWILWRQTVHLTI